MAINCERYHANIDVATCVARQQAAGPLGKGCKGCEEGVRVMAEHKENEFTVETYKCGRPKITGICMDCGERKIVISKKNPICKYCSDIRKGKTSPGHKRRRRSAPAPVAPGDFVFTVDLCKFKGLASILKEQADKELRTVSAQIIWELLKAHDMTVKTEAQ